MTSKKNTNKALFSSVIALILCCSMLVGTTFAWFTDEVKSGVNQIVAGNLDVDVLVNGDSIQDKAVLFDEVKLWEPGVVAYENLTVVNQGNLALKYELSVNFDNATKTPAGKTLADVLQVGVVPGGVSGGRDEVVSKVTTWQPLKSFIEAGELLTQGAEKTYGIVIAWVPGANDNDYNMNNGQTTVLSVDLGVQLTAWQKDAEKDSFDETYDAVVYTESQLQDAINAGGNIQLGGDIELDEPLVVPAAATTYSMRSAAHKVVLDLNGHVINVGWAEGSTTNHIYAFENYGDLTITGNGTINARGIFNYGVITLENGTINAIDGNGGYAIRNYEGAELIMNGGTIATTLEDDNKVDNGGYDATTVRVDAGATFTMNNGVINNISDFTFAIDNYGTTTVKGGTITSVHTTVANYGTLTIEGGKFTCNGLEGVTAHAVWAASGNVTINGGTFDGKDNYNGFNVDASKGAVVEIYGGNFLPAHSGSLYGEGTIKVYGGTFAGDPSKRVAAGYTAANMGNGTWTVVKGEIAVSNADELAAAVAAGKTEIYLQDGEYNVYDCGGKNLTINGSKNAVIKLYNEGEDGCDYGFGGNGTGVGHVTFNGVTIDTTANTGNYKGFAYMKGTFNDCNFVGAFSLNNANDYAFNRCTFDFKNGYFWTWSANSVTFDGCTFNGNSKAILAHGYASTVITIKGCTFAATEKGYTGAGDNTAAVEIDPAETNTYTIKFIGENTITSSYAAWTRVKDGSTGHTITGLN